MSGFPSHIHASLLDELETRGFKEPTPVQSAVLDLQHAGKDLLVSSQTGSGKTVAFGAAAADALVAQLDGQSHLPRAQKHRPPEILVIAPTRELALQVQRELMWLYKKLGATVASCVGGVDIHRERRALFHGVHAVVGTPGRLVDHLTRKSLDLSRLSCVVLDEADEMLDMGFREELETILDACPPARRTLLFSATLPSGIAELARRYQKDAVRISASANNSAHQDIEVQAHLVSPDERERAVVNVLRYYDPARALVFVALRETVTRLQARLAERGFSAVALSGELSQAERTRALQALRDGRARVLVATDVAARGLDLPEVSLVIHADVANDPITMTHRNGRTGRAGRKGTAVILAVPSLQRTAEMQLLAAGSRASWTPLPSAPDVRIADRERLLARLKDEAPTLEDDDRQLGVELLEAHGAEHVSAMLAHALRSALPQPEDVPGSLDLRPSTWTPRPKKEFRRGKPPFHKKGGRPYNGPPAASHGPKSDGKHDGKPGGRFAGGGAGGGAAPPSAHPGPRKKPYEKRNDRRKDG